MERFFRQRLFSARKPSVKQFITKTEEQIFCDDCGSRIYPIEMKNSIKITNDWRKTDEYVCQDCKDNYEQCSCCGEWVWQDDLIYCEDDGEYYCDSCANENLYYCEKCEQYHSYDDRVEVYTRYGSQYWCQDCADNFASRCADCGSYFDDDYYTLYEGDDGDYYCEDCIDYHRNEYEEENGDRRIWDYHDHKSESNIFYGEAKKCWQKYLGGGRRTDNIKHCVGFELEVDYGNDKTNCIDDIEDILGDDRVYYESDGSLSEDGFEIISQPHTFEEFWRIKDKWAEMLQAIKDNGFSSHDAKHCGLHIHISREAFGANKYKQSLAVGKIINFLESYKNDIKRISRRNDMGYCGWFDFECGTKINKITREIYRKAGRYYGDRYHTVNTSNGNTIEFRFFRGTLNEKSFFASFDFIFNLVKNSKNIKWSECHDVNKWLEGMSEETIDYIKSRHAFEEYLNGESKEDEENYIEEVA